MTDNIMSFVLIDKNEIIPSIFTSCDINEACNMYLSKIYYNLKLLLNNNVKINKNIQFDNIYVVSKLGNFTCDIIKFNLETLLFTHNSTSIILYDNMTTFITLISNLLNTTNSYPSQLIIKKANSENLTQIKKKVPELKTLDDSIDLDEKKVESYIESLEKLKKEQSSDLENIKKSFEEKSKTFSEVFNNLGDNKRELRMLLEREEQRMRIFESDKQIYYKIKDQLSQNNIPILFVKQYPIFEFLDSEKILGTLEDYETYCELYDSLYDDDVQEEKNYVPHNIHFLDDDKKKQYKNIDKHETDIETFINKSKETKYKPLNVILSDISSDESDDDYI